jgi:hypothetical protein
VAPRATPRSAASANRRRRRSRGDGRCGQILAAAGADLDLRGDQLAGDRRREQRVGRRCLAKLLEPGNEVERPWIEERELLLQTDGEVR